MAAGSYPEDSACDSGGLGGGGAFPHGRGAAGVGDIGPRGCYIRMGVLRGGLSDVRRWRVNARQSFDTRCQDPDTSASEPAPLL